ncbi:hypothetical protein [Micromonospora sp. NPDC050495]|uniref:hypothetical protein n=1 Tax=Micromonospora sp. NPDC050495 TaxID=3154936 RepID=UPI0033E19EBE
MTPHHLHALAAAWSLHNARQHLAQLARDEQRDIDAARLKPADGLRSPVYGTRHPSGGHSDPLATLLLGAERPDRVNRWAVLLDRADRVTTGVATMLRLTGDDPLSQIIAASPRILPGTAAEVAQHLQDEDGWLRPAIGMWPQREPMPGVPCPACQRRTLHVQTAGPESAWTVVCAADCRCTGEGCRCGMPGAVEATVHIWPRETVLGAGSNGGCHD